MSSYFDGLKSQVLSSASLTFTEFTVGDINVLISLDTLKLGTACEFEVMAGEVPLMSKLPSLE